MGTISDKLTYLNETKNQLKTMISYGLETPLSNETFREYVSALKQALINSMSDTLNPTWNNLPKISSTPATSLSINNTLEAPMRVELNPSELSQDGTPTPSSPQDIHTISGDNTISVKDENNANGTDYSVNLDNIEYCKIGNYEDKFIRTSGKNLLPTQENDWEQGSLDTNGEVSSTTRIRTKEYYLIENDTNYHITITNTNYCFLNIYLYNSSKRYIGQYYSIEPSINGTRDMTINIPSSYASNLAYMRVIIKKNDNTSTITPSEITTILPMINEGTTALPYEPYGTNEWYIKKNIGKKVYSGTSDESWIFEKTGSYNRFYILIDDAYVGTNRKVCLSNYFKNNLTRNDDGICFIVNRNVFLYNNDITTANDFKTWLSTHNTGVYYILATPTYTKITGTLAEQLESIYNAMSKDGQTNISQTNDDLPFILDVTALEKLEI
ncbi:MAG: hypothetical protein IKU37_01345 [Candidatus Gastranaerophilales bacterium]|nr:hypothetical protein [Candidatus Gastranaerophilales bacterium]